MQLLQFQINVKKKVMGSAIMRTLDCKGRLKEYTVIKIMLLRRRQFTIIPVSGRLGAIFHL